MKTSPKFCRHALALLFAVTIGTATAQAQKQAEEKIILPPSPAPPIAQPLPTPLQAKPVADKLAPAGWMRYEVGEPLVFSLLLPTQPMGMVDRVNVAPGVEGISRIYLSVADTGVYGVSFMDALPAELLTEPRRRTFFEGFSQEFAEGFQARMKERGMEVRLTMLEQRAASASGMTGYEQDFSYGQVMGRVRVVFGAGSAYAVMAIWNGLSLNSERSAFFESLKVSAKR
ncbi:MAG TPA: hypothetical protein VGB76_10915 [Pyrinomonadaceae bacterium]